MVTQTKDNLRSNDALEVILALCHGPIKGLARGTRSFFINDTALENEDNTSNFINANLVVHPGNTPGETIRPLLGGFEDFRGVWTKLDPGNTLSIDTRTPGVRSVIIRLAINELWRRSTTMVAGVHPSDGITQHRAHFTILWRTPGGVFQDPFDGEGYTIFGKTQEKEIHEIRLEMHVDGPFEISIRQNTADTANEPCDVTVEGYYEVQQGMYGLTRSNNVGTVLAPGVPVVRTTQPPTQRLDGGVGIDLITVRLVVNQLFISNTSGTFEDELEMFIEVKATSNPTWSDPFSGTVKIKGKTSGSPVVFEYRLPTTPTNDTYDVRVTRVSGDLAEHFRQISWESFQESVGGPARFDGVACVQVSARASSQFSSQPEFSGIYDLKLVKVPVNYDPVTRAYTGVWDGTFKLAWTDNPAWCWYDLAMDDTYGARQFWPEISVDRYSVYEVGKWCDELVPDGRGGTQPRWTCNGTITQVRGVRDQLRYMAGSFNAVPVDTLNGQIRLSVDKNTEAVAIFTPENVVDGEFSYSYSDVAVRYNEITVRFVNKEMDYTRDSRVARDLAHQEKYGRIPFEFAAENCRDSREAFRRAVYRLITSTTEVETVSFRTNRRGLLVEVFDTILVGDPDMGRSLTGRIGSLSSDRKTINLRDPLYLEAGVLYDLTIDVPDITAPRGVVPKTYHLAQTYAGYTYQLVLTQALPENLPMFMPFALGLDGSSLGVPKAYRVVEVSEDEGNPDNVKIEAVEVNRNKQFIADNATEIGGIIQLNLPGTIAAPASLTVTTTTRLVNNETKVVVVLSWPPSSDPRVLHYRVQWRESGSPTWIDAGTTRTSRFEIFDVPETFFDFRVSSVFGDGQSAWIEQLAYQAGTEVPPSDVTGLEIEEVADNVRLTWIPVPDLDFSHYVVRHDPTAVGATWFTAETVVQKTLTTDAVLPWKEGAYFVKAVDLSGVESTNAAMVALTATPPDSLSDLSATGGIRSISVSWALPTNNPMFDLVEVWENTSSASGGRYFVASTKASGYLRTDLLPNQTRWFWIRARDRRGFFSSFIGPVSATTSLLVAADLQDAILNTAKFAAGIEPVTIVTVLPTTKQTEMVFLTTDDKLYRWNGTAYTAAVPASDIAGQIITTQISDNAVTTDKITANAITADKITANAVTFGKIAAGAVRADQIAANEINAGHLAATTIITSAAQMGTAVVSSASIGDLQVNSAKIADLTVGNTKITGNAISTLWNGTSNPGPATYSAGSPYSATQLVAVTVNLRGEGRCLVITRLFGITFNGPTYNDGGDSGGEGAP